MPAKKPPKKPPKKTKSGAISFKSLKQATKNAKVALVIW